jgi:hypothetical protein
MSSVGLWIGGYVERWLTAFKRRHGLAESTPPGAIPPLNDVTANQNLKRLLHVACGVATMADIPVTGFKGDQWCELRLDADASVQPDIAGSMTDMSMVQSDGVDAIYSSHGIEHLYWHDVPKALSEFLRVLNEQGFAVITCPDVQAAAAMIAEDRMFDTAYESAAGAITPFDILYSYRPYVERNPQWMAHHCGFTFSTLAGVLRHAGFASVAGFRRPDAFDLWLLASKSSRSDEEMRDLARAYLIPTA